jgi:formylglycine-generating enzyme required for sulfatase activity
MWTGNLLAGAPTGTAWQRRLTEQGVPPAHLEMMARSIDVEADDRPHDAGVVVRIFRRIAATPRPVPLPAPVPIIPPQPATIAPAVQPAVVREPGTVVEYEIASGGFFRRPVQMKFCWIPAGRATLGSPLSETGRNNDEDEHQFATIGFWLGKYEVTQHEWNAVWVRKSDECSFRGADLPVENVSLNECREFIEKLNADAKPANLVAAFGGVGKFDLPHEDEWEYACRGGLGNKRAFYWGDSLNGDNANCAGNHPYGTTTKGENTGRTTPVGSYECVAPHPWGLCDMHGNVWEWCENFHSSGNKYRVLRGGSWRSIARRCRAAYRIKPEPVNRSDIIGFRIVFRLN